jgi:hypothetical protein
MKKDDGGWVEEDEEKRSFIANFFSELFRSNGGSSSPQLLNALHSKVTAGINESLLKEFMADEVKHALDGIGDLEAPGPDGMPSLFYKKFWDIVGDQVVAEVLQVLNGGQMPEGWNETTKGS